MKRTSCLLLFTLLLTSCPTPNIFDDYDFDYETIITEEAVNLDGINSSFDDYNSTLPYEAFASHLYFSSNRFSRGEHFDIIYKRIEISYHDRDDILNISYTANPSTPLTSKLLGNINTDFDELGPLYYFGPSNYSYFMSASNENGDFDIKSIYWDKSNFGTYQATEEISDPYFLKSINSDFDDLYPTFSENSNELYFCSNRNSDHFNIYKVNINESMIQPHNSDNFDQIGAELITDLSSEANDKCPSIFGNIMVFASDRQGGSGGFDLYYAINENGVWSSPVNLGDKVNTEFDEYRPILSPVSSSAGALLIFSSNRPDGKGGFDLYGSRNHELMEMLNRN